MMRDDLAFDTAAGEQKRAPEKWVQGLKMLIIPDVLIEDMPRT